MNINWKRNRVWIVGLVGLIVIVGSWWWFKHYYVDAYHSVDPSKAHKLSPGEVGDMFGMYTTLFIALAFFGAGLAIWLQSRELSEQRKELSLTRLEFEMNRATNVILKQLEKFELKRETFMSAGMAEPIE